MVALTAVEASNAALPDTLPSPVVGVFAGATSGIGEYILKSFARHVAQPRAYFIGRNQEAGDRIAEECRKINSKGEFHFIKADTSLLHNVDSVCAEIRQKEEFINLLVLTQGTLIRGHDTEEGIHFPMALVHYARARFIANLLPLIEQAPSLRRVLSVFTGTKEGAVVTSDLQGRHFSFPLASRGHACSLQTLQLAHFAAAHPSVSFIHTYPGVVRSGITRGTTGILFGIMKIVLAFLVAFFGIPEDQSGDRHLWTTTSAVLPAKQTSGVEQGVKGDGELTRGVDGVNGSGMYVLDEHGEPAAVSVEQLVTKMKEDGTMDTVWKDIEDEFVRVTGKTAL